MPTINPNPSGSVLAPIRVMLNEELSALDYLGFDSLGQARAAIIQHSDFASRWEMPKRTEKIGNSYRALYLSLYPQTPVYC